MYIMLLHHTFGLSALAADLVNFVPCFAGGTVCAKRGDHRACLMSAKRLKRLARGRATDVIASAGAAAAADTPPE